MSVAPIRGDQNNVRRKPVHPGILVERLLLYVPERRAVALGHDAVAQAQQFQQRNEQIGCSGREHRNADGAASRRLFLLLQPSQKHGGAGKEAVVASECRRPTKIVVRRGELSGGPTHACSGEMCLGRITDLLGNDPVPRGQGGLRVAAKIVDLRDEPGCSLVLLQRMPLEQRNRVGGIGNTARFDDGKCFRNDAFIA